MENQWKSMKKQWKFDFSLFGSFWWSHWKTTSKLPYRIMKNDFENLMTAKELPPIMFYEPVMPKRLLPHVLSSAKLFWKFCISRYFRFSRFSTNLHSKSNGKSMKITKNLNFNSFCHFARFRNLSFRTDGNRLRERRCRVVTRVSSPIPPSIHVSHYFSKNILVRIGDLFLKSAIENRVFHENPGHRDTLETYYEEGSVS